MRLLCILECEGLQTPYIRIYVAKRKAVEDVVFKSHREQLHYMNEYQKQIIRYKHLRSIYYSDSENRVSLEDKEFKSMLIQLKRSIMTKRNRTTENQILFKSEFPEE